MDINFPLILFVLIVIGAAIWIADIVWFRKHRAPDAKEPMLVENARALTPVLALVFLIRSFLYEPFQIPSGSMEQTLLVGDFILVNKYTYGIRLPILRTRVISNNDPQRGDVMVFFPPHKNQYYIKRVVGLPGDKIEYRNKVLYVNGQMQEQKQLPGSKRSIYRQRIEKLGNVEHQIQLNITVDRKDNVSLVVPENHYYMMGDNRDNSADSREWGPVHESRIVGKAVAIWMHKKPGWHLPTFSRAGGFN